MTGPLADLVVVEFAGIGPCPFAGAVLAGYGARVTVIDRPGGPAAPGPLDTPVNLMDWGKTVERLDLKSPAGRDRAMSLLAGADVAIEGFRPGVMERLGLGPAPCLEANPRLVFGRVTGWGQEGPLALTAGHDINFLALSGVLGALGAPGRLPAPPLNLLGDYAAGSMLLVTGILAALHERAVTGRGQVVDAAIVDGLGQLMRFHAGLRAAGMEAGAPGTNLLDGGCPFYRAYRCAEGTVAVGCLEPAFFRAFVLRLGLDPAWAARQFERPGWPALEVAIAERLRTRTRDEWAAWFDGTDCCVTPVLSPEEAPHHPHLRARASHEWLDGVPVPAPAPRFRQAQPDPDRS